MPFGLLRAKGEQQVLFQKGTGIMKSFKAGFVLSRERTASLLIGIILCLASAATAQTVQTNLAVTVRHAPSLNGNGLIEGSVQQLLGENVTLNGGFTLTGDLLVPGTPTLRVNGNPTFAGTIVGSGSASPGGYQITFNGNCSLRHLRTRTTPVSLPTVTAPPQPAGTRTVTINKAGQSIGDPATLRDLTLNGNVGQVTVPPGTYGTFTVNGGSGLVLGVAGGLQAVNYNLQNLNLNGNSTLKVVGPVVLTVANGFTANGTVGTTNRSSWLQLQVASGGFTLNGGCTIHGSVTAPAGTVIINGNSLLVGSAQCDRLTVNGGGCIKWGGSGAVANQPPVANSQNPSTPEDTALTLTLTGSDPEGAPLTYTLLSQPAHGTLNSLPGQSGATTGQPSTLNQFIYTPNANFNGSDSFTFKVNDGQADSAAATVVITVTPVNDAPVALGQNLSTPEDTSLEITLAGTDVDRDPLTYQIVTPPAKGSLALIATNRFLYTPASNTNGLDHFTFSVSDGQLRSTNTVSITIQAVNDAPVAGSQTVTTDEDTPVPVVLSALDVEGDGLTFTNLTQPAHGTLSGMPPNLIYTPATNYNGNDAFQFIASDRWLDSAPATISLIIKPVNDAPVAAPQVIITPEDTATNLVLTASDVEGDSLSFILLTAPTNGTLSGTAPNLVFSPAADFNGTNTFAFVASDGQATSAPVVVTLIVTPVNDQPIAEAQAVNLDEDTPTPITLRGTDVDGDTLTFFIVTPTTNGTLSGTAPNFIYAPATNFSGVDYFTFGVNDGTTNSLTAAITLTIHPVNDAPVADGQSVTTDEDTPLILTLTGSDGENDSLTFEIVEPPAHGTLSLQPSTLNQFIYTPATNYNGPDSFTFVANDGQTNSVAATVAITVKPVNDAPVAQYLNVNTLEDQPANGNLVATDADGDALTFALGTPAMKGTVMVAHDGRFTYQPNPNVNGNDHFTFTVTDGSATATGMVNVVIAPVNDPPVATPQTVTTDENVPLAIALIGTDVDGDTLTFQIVNQPAHGTLNPEPLTLNKYTYTPATDYIGPDSVTFKVNDGWLDSAPATIAINVQTVTTTLHLNVPGEQTVPQGMALAFKGDRLISITDEDAGLGVLELSLSASNGTLALGSDYGLDWQAGANGTSNQVVRGTMDDLNAALAGLKYLNSPGFSGTDLLSVTVDDLGNTDLGINFKCAKTIRITIIPPPNNPPKVSIVAPADTSQFQVGQAITVEATATDCDGQVNNVTLLADGRELAELAAPPFATAWTNATLGRHVLSAVATDDHGDASVSSDVSIWVVDESGDFIVEAGPDQIISLPNSASLAGTVEIQTPVSDAQTNVTWSKLDGPGDVQFSDPHALIATAQFNEPGTYTLKLQADYAGGTRSDLLKVDVIPAPPNRLTAARSNKGTDFWLTFLYNGGFSYDPPYEGCHLYVSADDDTTVAITYSDEWGNQWDQHLRVLAGSATTVSLPYWMMNVPVSDSIQCTAVHVIADHLVAVHALDYFWCSTDGYLALPTAMFGTDYIVLSYENSFSWKDPDYVVGGTEFAVLASEDDTSVTITPSVTVDSRTAGVPFEIILQKGEVYQLINFDVTNADLTGTTIKSDKPVAVFGGHACALVPPGVGAADHLVEELPPVNMWGRHFVTMPLAGRANGDTFRFLAATNGTRVAINGKVVATLDRGQFYEQIIDCPAEILASKPILVAQYANGTGFDDATGDPFMMLIPPFEQFGGDYLLSTAMSADEYDDPPRLIFTNNYVNLTVRSDGAGTILLDGVAVPADRFQPIGDGRYAGAQVPVDPGVHRLSAPVPFGACVYGWAWCESYAFMGGIYFESVESDAKLELAQPTPFAAAGHEKTVTARLTNGRGLPISDLEVNFSAAGANSATGRVVTSRSGEAIFSYTGTNAGVDVITATLPGLEQAVTNTWITASDNAPPIVSTAGTQPQQFNLTAQLVGTVSDDGLPAGANLNAHWRLLAGVGDVQLEDATQPSTRAFCSEPGTYQFELVADDSQFSSRSVVDVTVARPFTVELSGVEPGTWFPTNVWLDLPADIEMFDDIYTNVEFFDGDVKLSEGMSTDLFLHSLSPGAHSITVLVTEEFGFQVRSEPLEFFATLPPQIEVILPDQDLTLSYENPTATFKARAWDPDGIVTNFAVYVGSILVFQTNGDQIDFTGLVHNGVGVAYGTQPVRFTATDDHGISTDVYTVNINLVPPTTTANLVSPKNGEYFRAGQTVDFVVQASVTPPAQLARANFIRWFAPGYGYSIGGASIVPFAIQWIPPGPGDYYFSTRVYTDAYTTQETPTVTIHVLPAIGVSIISPTNSAQWFVGTPSPIVLALDDPTEAFDHAEFFANGVSLGQTTNTWFEWVPQQTGDCTLTAKVYDYQGRSYNADSSVTIQVVPPPPPQVVITSPTEGSRLALERETVVAVDVNDPAQAVTNLELAVDGIKVAESPSSYIPWTPNSTGSHALTVVAADWNGHRVASAPVNVTVVEMHPPTVTVTSPADGIHFTVETLPPLSAEASDSDGMVTNLVLELDGTVLGETNGTTLELPAINVLGGWHTVLARATDNDSLTTASTAVSFFIERSEDANLPVPEELVAQAVSATEIRLNWLPLPTNTPASSVLVERWSTELSAWVEIGKAPVTETNYADSNLNPETCYRYRAATTDNKVHRSAYSAEARATTRTVVPNYSVIDLTAALSGMLNNRGPAANILTNAGLNHFDWRRTVPLDARHAQVVLGTNTAALVSAVARFKERWPHIQLDYDPVLLSPKSVMPRLGYLTGPGGAGVTVSDATAQMFDPDDPDRPVKAFLQEYQALFGFGPEALNDAAVQRDYVSAVNNARTVVWQQQVAGVPVFDALLISHITQAGELACLSSEFIPAPAQAADPAMLAAVQSGADLPVPAQQALVTAVTNIGNVFDISDAVAQSDAAGVTRQQTFTATDGIKGDAHAELTWFPASRTQLRLCWQVLFTSHWHGEMYLTLVTADTGEILYRRNLTTESSVVTYRVFTNANPEPLLPGWSVPSSAQPSTAERGLVTLAALDDTASPNGWIADGDNETRGNNVDAHLDRNDDDIADLPRPTGNPSRVFDFALDLSAAPANYSEAATVQLFYWDNWMHDALYRFGFTEAAGNFQMDNFGRGGLGNDAIQADAQDGLTLNDNQHANNANMSVPPDGYAPHMQMFIFDGASPSRDGSLDAGIVLHEYTHGLSGRLVGGGAGIDALATAGMGEGWSDFYALALLADPAADVDGTYPIGSYVAYHGFGTTFDENYYYGIRHYPYCTDTNKNPLTFADIDPWKAGAHDGVPRNPLLGPFRADLANEVHSQGEVWCMMLWEMRANLIRKHGPEAGNSLTLQLVTDGLKLSPPNPNFVQARDAILLADRMWSGGANAAEIWSAFAKRGLGFNAKAPESYTTSGVQESYDLMPALATERVEIQNTSGSVELGVNNNLLIHVRNQGNAAATHVSGQLSSTAPGVTVLQGVSTYSDIPQNESRANDVVFQIQTGAGFTEGTPIDLVFVITSDQSAGTNYLRLFTGVPGAEILFDNYSAMADTMSASSAPKDLTPWDIDKSEPLWMADDASCLLKAGEGKYVLWKPDGSLLPINNENFLVHRLTRNGVVVGALVVTNTLDEMNDKITNSVGAWWFFPLDKTGPLTQEEYHWPKGAAPLLPAGMAFSLTNLTNGQPQYLTNVTVYPMLQDVWDQNSNGVAVGSVSVQEQFSWQRIWFGADGTMNWFKASERGLDAGSGTDSVTELRYYALLTTAAQFNNINDWRWLGPLSWGISPAVALLVNDAGMIAGYGGIYTGDPTLDALRPTHAFRAPASGEFDGSAIILTNDLGVLPGGLHSFPRAMNQAGELVGYSDFDAMSTGGLIFDPTNSHAVFWGLTDQTPEYLTNLPPSAQAPKGYGDAYALNDSNQIVGASMAVDGRFAAVMWQRNHNTNGASSTNSAPFWEITDLNNRLTDPTWQVFRAVGINNDGLILAHAFNAKQEKHAVLLIPGAMTTDVNRDGKITFDGSDLTSSSNPFRFWINDSQESGDISSAADDIPRSDSAHVKVKFPFIRGASDLVNFFPVVLNLRNVLRLLPPSSGYEYHLSQADNAVIFIYTSLTRTNAFDYLTNPSWWDHTHGRDLYNTYATQVKAKGITLNEDFLNRILLDGNEGVILMEGCTNTTNPLILEIWHKGQKLAGIPLYLNINSIEDMYRHLNLRNGPDAPMANDVAGGLTGRMDDTAPVSQMNDCPAFPDVLSNDRWIVFLHGFNVGGNEARGWNAEMFKRFYWSRNKARFVGVSWFGNPDDALAGLPPDYHLAVRNALATAPKLAEIINGLSGPKTIVAHSLGCCVVASAIADHGMNVNNSCFIDAALARECFDGEVPSDANGMTPDEWRSYDSRLYAANWYERFPATDARSILTWRNRFTNAVLAIHNFYSSTEDVLAAYDGEVPGWWFTALTAAGFNGDYAWVFQEKAKGDKVNYLLGLTHAGSYYGGWGFNLNDALLTTYSNWYVIDSITGQRRVKNPGEIGTITASLLDSSRYSPLFKTGWGTYDRLNPTLEVIDTNYKDGPDWIFDLYGIASGNTIASDPIKRNQLLAEAIPALSLPAGANKTANFTSGRNYNLPTQFADTIHWPRRRDEHDVRLWLHSDVHDVAYLYQYKLFDKLVSISNQ
jgi:VCBS repeat-containing protein